jgi:hypothetical protein
VQIQKVIPGTLEALSEALSEHPTITYYGEKEPRSLDTSHVVFLLISDIGWHEIMELLITHKSIEEIPPHRITTAVKAALDDQWARLR